MVREKLSVAQRRRQSAAPQAREIDLIVDERFSDDDLLVLCALADQIWEASGGGDLMSGQQVAFLNTLKSRGLWEQPE